MRYLLLQSILLVALSNMAYSWSLANIFKSFFETSQIEMPDYQVLSSNGNFEIRKYPATKWVGTSFRVGSNLILL